MKNKNIIIVIGTLILLIIVILFNYYKYYDNNIENQIMNKKWYKYNCNTGYYDIFYVENDTINYKNEKDNFKNCNKYYYDMKNNIIELDCGKKISIETINSNKLVLSFDNINHVFYDNIEDSLNYEFIKNYKKSISEYKKEMNRIKEISKINYDRLLEKITLDENSKVFIIPNKCTRIECTLVLDTMEQLISKGDNISYLEISNIDNNKILFLNKKYNLNIDNNNIYPKVLIIKNKNIIDSYDFICEGFNCKKYLEK